MLLFENKKSKHQCQIQHIRISLDATFNLKKKFSFSDQMYPKGVLFGQRRKLEHQHRIQHIRNLSGFSISCETIKFVFLDQKFAQKMYFSPKVRQTDITLEFNTVDLV